jgi:hypothetical protein
MLILFSFYINILYGYPYPLRVARIPPYTVYGCLSLSILVTALSSFTLPNPRLYNLTIQIHFY